jgi:hypothetical protein
MKYLWYGVGVTLPLWTFLIGMNYGHDAIPQPNVGVTALKEEITVLSQESNDRLSTIIQLTDAVNILSSHYNKTSGNMMVPVIVDGEKRLIIK